MRVMAIDYGDARTGLAISDAMGILCGEAFTVAEWNTEKLIARIAEETKSRGVERLVLGLPKNMDGTEGRRAAICRRFGSRINDRCDIPVVFWDERRTTITAAAILAENETYGIKRKEKLDSVSAAVILESYLDWRKHHPGEVPE